MAAIANSNSADALLSTPTNEDATNPFMVNRINDSNDNKNSYISKSTKFVVKGHNFQRQFSHIYFKRLEALKPRVLQQAKKKFPNANVVERVIELKAGEQIHAVTGTLYKNMKLKPCVLDEYTNEAILQGLPPPKANYTNEDDSLILEDETGRITLILEDTCDFTVDQVVSGVVAGVRGKISGTGEMVVDSMCFAGLPSAHSNSGSDATTNSVSNDDDDAQYVMFVSGIGLGSEKDDMQRLQLNILCDYISGHVGSPMETTKVAAKISRVVVVGNSLAKPPPRDDQKAISREEQDLLAAPLREMDSIFAQIARSVPIDLMPGNTDPSNVAMPQQPLHNCLFPKSSGYKKSFNAVTNPYRFQTHKINFIGHSGQPVSNIKKFSKYTSDLDILQRTLEWQHLAPTAPDTLACYPFYKRDPFVLDDKLCPHVLFSGNMESYGDRLIKGDNGQSVRLITIPKFNETCSAVLLNLKTLESSEISFQLDMPEDVDTTGKKGGDDEKMDVEP
jgi:DNA polymerase delta subunit 2